MIKKLARRNESIMACLVVVVIAICAILSPEFRTVNTVFNLLRATIVFGIMAIPCLLVFIVGGIDLSFMSIASFSMYASVKLFSSFQNETSIIWMFLFGMVIGIILGLINSFFVTVTKMPIFIVTLGTQFVFSGACIAFVGTTYLQVPSNMVAFSTTNLISTTDAAGNAIGLNVSILILVALFLIMFAVLRYTKFGRTLYAMGGSIDSARRSGINVTKNMTMLFALSGAICAIGGVLNGSLLRLAVPGDMVGGELTVIAAVILGGADSSKGKGTIVGTILGIILITIISNTLNLLKIPTYWQTAVIGAIIILGTIFGAGFNQKDKALKS